MAKIKDIVGIKYGGLTVVSFCEIKNGHTLWNCLCDCGNYTIVDGGNLKNGSTLVCGSSAHRIFNLVGKRYGRLLVLSFFNRKNKGTFWECLCDCKKIRIVNGQSLKNGSTTSCGCYQKESVSENRFCDLTGNTYGKLTVVRFFGYMKNRISYWDCVCECGGLTTVKGSNLKNGSTKSCGCLSESFVASEVKKYFADKYGAISEYKILKNPKTKMWLPYDAYLPNENVFIEINGKQHYKFIKGWHLTLKQFEHNKRLDRIKRKFARQNGTYVEIDLRKIRTPEEAIDYVLLSL